MLDRKMIYSLKKGNNNKFNFEIERTGEYPLKPLFNIPSRFSKYKMTSVYKKY